MTATLVSKEGLIDAIDGALAAAKAAVPEPHPEFILGLIKGIEATRDVIKLVKGVELVSDSDGEALGG